MKIWIQTLSNFAIFDFRSYFIMRYADLAYAHLNNSNF